MEFELSIGLHQMDCPKDCIYNRVTQQYLAVFSSSGKPIGAVTKCSLGFRLKGYKVCYNSSIVPRLRRAVCPYCRKENGGENNGNN